MKLIGMVCFSLALSASLAAAAETGNTDATSPESTVQAFHEALRSGDAAAVQRLLAPDAVILEGGERETREEYLGHHLEADIAFSRAIPARVVTLDAEVQGDVAWVNSTSEMTGAWHDKPLRLVGAELVVLTRAGSAWQIRAIHWSSAKQE